MAFLYGPEAKERAYQAWRRCDRNMAKTHLELRNEGLCINRNTIYCWIRDYGWTDRVEKECAEEKIIREKGTDNSVRLIADLEAQKTRYDRFFESLGEKGIDVQATYAYTTLVKTIADVRKKAAAKPDLYAMAPVVMDEFVKFVKTHKPANPEAGKPVNIERAVFDLIDRFFEEIKPE